MKREKRDAEIGKPLTIIFDSVAVHYQWTHEDVPGLSVTVTDEPLEEIDGMPVAIGAGPRRVFSIMATEPGKYDINFKLAPAWGGKAEEKKSFEISVRMPKQG